MPSASFFERLFHQSAAEISEPTRFSPSAIELASDLENQRRIFYGTRASLRSRLVSANLVGGRRPALDLTAGNSIIRLASWAGSRGRLGRFCDMIRVCRERRPDARGDRALPYSKEPTTCDGSA